MPAPQPLAAEKFGKEPKARSVPARVADPDALAKVNYSLPPLLPAKPAAKAPASPAERVPFNMGVGATAVPAKSVLPDAPGITQKARDAKQPPAGVEHECDDFTRRARSDRQHYSRR